MNTAVLDRAPLTAAFAPSGDAPGQVSRYGVVVGSQRLLLAADGAVRVLEPPPAFRLPNTHRWFLGLANVRGTLVPVHDLAAWLEQPVPDTGRMLLVVGDGEAAAGVLIDASPRHLLVPADAGGPCAQAMPGALAPYAGAAFEVAGETWIAVDWSGLFMHLRTLALVAG